MWDLPKKGGLGQFADLSRGARGVGRGLGKKSWGGVTHYETNPTFTDTFKTNRN